MEQINLIQLKEVNGGTYYGNGVSCDKNGCTVDRSKAWYCGVNRWGAAVATGGKATIGNC
ncbi:leucocin A/sakacin P family class II bacteriocin [Clostridium sp. Marseille-Q2269]|uniref:leucocin A/sakacin P family class II bacteriocin n=1 Tax=Clostridium sp. Marseille-Q2269 TaxID=2942205 RepID=UPI002072D2FC|nr:leucocin A/sakacin P family class II bacteriocin [Clostridium sp. Marseille-Q2269]